MKRTLLRTARSVALIYVLLLLLVGCAQRLLIYHPIHRTEAAMLGEARALGCEPWRDAGGSIIGWKSAHHESRAANRLVVFDGNTGYALHRRHYLRGFEKLDRGGLWEVFLFEYPGYGARPGEVSEQSFIAAGDSALAALAQADSRPVFLAGESLGSGLASALAGRHPEQVRGVFLLTPYARLGEVGARQFPFLPVKLLLHDRWDNVEALRVYRRPLAMLIAGRDEVVTAAQGRALYNGYAGPKRLWVEEDATHNTVDFDPAAPWWREVSDFLLGPRAL